MEAYLDNAASAPMRPEAVEAMIPMLRECYGNPSGAHRMARDARRAIDDARDVIAAVLGGEPGEIVFTGSGSEADNLAIHGACTRQRGVPVCSAIEHHAVLHPVEQLAGRVVGVDELGVIRLDALADALDERVALVSVMLVNNETGVVQPIAEVAEVVAANAPNAVFHTDAIQGFCWLDLAEHCASADMVSISAHKFGGPKGVGALLVRGGVDLDPQILGGGQERGLRSGTHNAPGIVAMAAAAEVAAATREETVARVGVLRDRLADGLLAAVADCVETGERDSKVAGSCHLCFGGVESESLLFLLEKEGVYASAASSCSSGAQDPSHVLAAMGYPRELAAGSLRLSLGSTTTSDDIDLALAVVPAAVERLRLFA